MIRAEREMETEVRERMRGAPGKVEILHLFKREELGGKCRLFAKLRLEPGSGIGYHEHENEEEIFYILAGRGVTEDDGERREVGVGDAILTASGRGHAIQNTGDTPMEILAAILLY